MDVKTLITLPVALIAAVFLAVSLGIVSWGVQKPIKADLDACMDSKAAFLCHTQTQYGLGGNWAQYKKENVDCPDDFDGKGKGDNFCKVLCKDEADCITYCKGLCPDGYACKATCSKSELKLTTKTQYRNYITGYVADPGVASIAKDADLTVDDYSYKCWRQGPAIGLIVAGLSCMVFVAALAFLAAQTNDTLVYIVAIVFAVCGMIAAVLGVAFALAANNPLSACHFTDSDLNKAVKKDYKEHNNSYIGAAGAVGLVGAILSVFVAVLAIVAFFLRPASNKGVTTTIHPGPN